MTARLLKGVTLSKNMLTSLKETIRKGVSQGLPRPGLAVILIGDDPASITYVTLKRQVCNKIGVNSKAYDMPSDTKENELLELIHTLNADESVHGILIQLPLPKHIRSLTIINAIKPSKDVDGFTHYNLGRLLQCDAYLKACTPKGIMCLLSSKNILLKSKYAVVVGASIIVGRPMMLELLNAGCTVTICHIETKNLDKIIKKADILVVAVGKANIIKGEWIKSGAVVVDVGMNRTSQGFLCGDVQFESAKNYAAWISPVPGGVGPMTIATLMENTVLAAWEGNEFLAQKI